MSITGSLVGYEGGHSEGPTSKKNRSLLNLTATSNASSKQCQSLNSSISNSVIQPNVHNNSVASSGNQQHRHFRDGGHAKKPRRLHLNTLWSVWYGVLITLLQAYLILQGAHRYLGLSALSWKYEKPTTELDIQIVFCGLVVLFLPLLLAAAMFRVGNLANDGIKLASGTRLCSSAPTDGLEEEAFEGTLRALWIHGGPTSAFIHIITAICLLLPRLLLEAKVIENGLLPKDDIWRTDLDFMVTHNDRLVVLSFMTSTYPNTTSKPSSSSDGRNRRPYQNGYFEQSDLVEKFSAYEGDDRDDEDDDSDDLDDDDDPFRTHEALEMERHDSASSISISTMENFNVLDNPTTTHTFPPIRNLLTTTTEASTTATTFTTTTPLAVTTRPTTLKKSKSSSRKQSSKSNGSRKEKPYQTNQQRFDDVDTRLELEPQKELDFDEIAEHEYTTLFEVNHSKQKQPGGRKLVPSGTAATNNGGASTSTTVATKPSPKVQSTKKTATTSKDSDTHIIKPMRLPENVIPSTPVTTNSKIIEIKPSTTGATAKATPKKIKRYTSENYSSESLESLESIPSVDEDEFIIKDENGMEIKPAFLIGTVPGNISTGTVQLEGFAGLLQMFLGVDQQFNAKRWTQTPSLEFINLAIALMAWAVRYPSVFWHTSKMFAWVFSLQMIANGVDILLSFAGASVLYKLQTLGQALPLQAPALILNGTVTIALTILALILTIASSMVLYLYGHGKLAVKIRDRRLITAKQSTDVWAYFAHCSSLCFVLALAVVKAPLLHDLSAAYRGSLDGAVLAAALGSVLHLFLWIVLWLALTAKRRWHFKLPPLEAMGGRTGSAQPLLRGGSGNGGSLMRSSNGKNNGDSNGATSSEEETVYWPKIAPNSPKLKVTFNEVTSTSSDQAHGHDHDGKRHPPLGATIRLSSVTGETDDGDYATLRGGPTGDLLHIGEFDDHPPPPEEMLLNPGGHNEHADDTSEEGKLLACVRDDSVTYASTRDLEPPIARTVSRETFMRSPEQQLGSPLAPVTVTVHNNEHVAPGMTPRCLRRADSGMPNEALTPRSDTTSTESSTSPPDCRDAPSETSSGVHSGEERDEVVIRPRSGPYKSIIKPPPPAIQEEPFGRSTNMKMSSFNKDGSSATLPLTRGSVDLHRSDYPQCSTMPLPAGYHHQPHHYHSQSSFTTSNSASRTQLQQHTTLPNGVRYSNSNNQFLKRMPYIKTAESPYGHLGLGSGHHTFSKLLHDPLAMPNSSPPTHSQSSHCTFTPIPEDRDSANYSMISDQDREMYINAGQINSIQ
ncbi:protein tincar [Uranotaenia lowii]|uniref:protein tincar n=1 Tax=Uranotaenia lowii TaxID=190385 RepID=UPI002478532E|nr:protein tincar [Uranotaenia lowii]XP_055607089.1 protein tincar [Uranotaenia lowii]XP_055607090.1 protein tincar [Uranotaenia lowii]XP_055607091.1 protein tincar [Uranotaenia lowii]XP_055607092.1 protein tincar [Uranotaenia lowii]